MCSDLLQNKPAAERTVILQIRPAAKRNRLEMTHANLNEQSLERNKALYTFAVTEGLRQLSGNSQSFCGASVEFPWNLLEAFVEHMFYLFTYNGADLSPAHSFLGYFCCFCRVEALLLQFKKSVTDPTKLSLQSLLSHRLLSPLAPTDLRLGSSLAIWCCRCASNMCW